MLRSKRMVIGFWIVTALFCLQIGFTAYAQLRLPQVAEMFTHLGFPAYFRVKFCWAKLLGVMRLVAPVPARLKEWAYAGFAITLGSALIAHLSVGDGPEAWSWAAATGVLWGLSCFFWRRLQAEPRTANVTNPEEPRPSKAAPKAAAGKGARATIDDVHEPARRSRSGQTISVTLGVPGAIATGGLRQGVTLYRQLLPQGRAPRKVA